MDKETIDIQIDLIKDAMKQSGLWSKEVPDWIRNYHEGPIVNIWQWLQFIHLPMRANMNLQDQKYLAPQLSPYLKSEPAHRKILQLIIELDSITSTMAKL